MKPVIFIDAGGIIIDTRKLAVHKRTILERYRMQYQINAVSSEEFFRQFKQYERRILKGVPLSTVMADFFASWHVDLNEKTTAEMVDNYLKGYKLNEFYDGSLMMLRSLKKEGMQIYVVSDAIEKGAALDAVFAGMLKQYHISEDFHHFYDRTVTSSDVGVMKKEGGAFFKWMLTHLELSPQQVLFIAHDADEIKSARVAKIPVFVFNKEMAEKPIVGRSYYQKVLLDVLSQREKE